MNAFGKLLTSEVRINFRDAPVSLMAVVFPVAVIAIFGSITHPQNSSTRFYFQPMSLSMAIGVLAFSLMATAIATYREKGILRRLAVTPVGPSRLLGAQLVVNLIISLVAIAAVILVGGFGFGFPFPRQPVALTVALVLSLAAVLGIGLFIAAIAHSGRTATGIGISFYFFNLIVGGVFIPPEVLPAILSRIGEFAPLGAMNSSLQSAWSGSWPSALDLSVLGGWAVLFGVLAVRLFKWE